MTDDFAKSIDVCTWGQQHLENSTSLLIKEMETQSSAVSLLSGNDCAQATRFKAESAL